MLTHDTCSFFENVPNLLTGVSVISGNHFKAGIFELPHFESLMVMFHAHIGLYRLLEALPLADPRGGARDARPPPRGSKFFHFHAVFGKNVKNNSNFGSWRPPPGENPGSATDYCSLAISFFPFNVHREANESMLSYECQWRVLIHQ